MAVQTEAPQGSGKKRFSLPSAYTILFILIVLAALATWFVPAGTYDLDKEGSPIPGTYKEIDSNPQRIVEDSLKAPINGLYGVENKKGNIDFYNTGTLLGAIDVALVHHRDRGLPRNNDEVGCDPSRDNQTRPQAKGRERWMIPLLMVVFAAGGTSYGMAEESLAFYALIITVMIAAGYDALTGASVVLLGCGIKRTLGSTINPFATGIAVRLRRHFYQRRLGFPIDHPDWRACARHLLRTSIRGSVKKDPSKVTRRGHEGGERGTFRGGDGNEGEAKRVTLTARHKLILILFGLAFFVMMYGVIPWKRSRGWAAHSVVVVPRDDRLVHPVLDPDRFGRKDA